ncbi:dihydroorotase [Blastopirellula marina]|uniref:Dihydroorotase n=1 Tax=Blastopirellula marina TaxID=124 RepID=A0A2S8G934_9BACT|nr:MULTISPECIES: dihydroorotase [Pirellulaceae]PQO40820.1 dihydroorotase [Blastopirellula marina]RCS56147.1 dihydroorotase [Bremerella cremea]
MKTLIKNATVILPDGPQKTSVLIDGAQIADIDPAESVKVDETVYAYGMTLIPGVIDAHVHMRDPGLTAKEDLRSGSRACAKGGITTFLEMPNTNPATISQKLLEEKLTLAANKSIVNYGFFVGATLQNMEELKKATRTPGIKIYMGSSTGDMALTDPGLLEAIFAETKLPIAVHAEDETIIEKMKQELAGTRNVVDHSKIRSVEAEVASIKRACALAREYKHRLHICHVSAGASVDIFEDHADVITAEVTPHHLFLNVDDYLNLGTLAQMNPSLKTQEDNEALFQALLDDKIQIVATDHAPHTWEEKCGRYPETPSGVPGVDTALPLMLDMVAKDKCTMEDVVHWMCEGPALVWDILEKGRIEVGYDADLVLIDMNKTQVIHGPSMETKCRWTPFEGREVTGWPVRTWVCGKEVYRDGKFDESRMGVEAMFDHSRGGYWAGIE